MVKLADERMLEVQFTDDAISVSLRDGASSPCARLVSAGCSTPPATQRNNWKVAGDGYGIHWPDIDEDLSTEGLLRGAPRPRRRYLEVERSAIGGRRPLLKSARSGAPPVSLFNDSKRMAL